MNRTYSIKQQWLPALALFCCLPSLAATVFRTVDANGMASFSDTKPEDDTSVETLIIDAQAPQLSDVEQHRLKLMRETADRMATARMAREKHRAELRLLEAQMQTQHQIQDLPRHQADNNPIYFGYSPGYPGYYNHPARRPWNRGHRSHREHPMTRPRLRSPGQGYYQPRRSITSITPRK